MSIKVRLLLAGSALLGIAGGFLLGCLVAAEVLEDDVEEPLG